MDDIARLVADVVNPVFVLLLIAAPWAPRSKDEGPFRFWLVSGLGIGIATLLAELGKGAPVWPGHDSFPSGHESVGLAAATSLVAYDRDWVWIAAPLAAILAWALVVAGYHDWFDIGGAVFVGPGSALICRRLAALFWNRSASRAHR